METVMSILVWLLLIYSPAVFIAGVIRLIRGVYLLATYGDKCKQRTRWW